MHEQGGMMTKLKITNEYSKSDRCMKDFETFLKKEMVKIYKEYVKARKSANRVYINMCIQDNFDDDNNFENTAITFNNAYFEDDSYDSVSKLSYYGEIQ